MWVGIVSSSTAGCPETHPSAPALWAPKTGPVTGVPPLPPPPPLVETSQAARHSTAPSVVRARVRGPSETLVQALLMQSPRSEGRNHLHPSECSGRRDPVTGIDRRRPSARFEGFP